MDCKFEQKSNDLELSNTQKINLRNWVSKNPNWKSIDDLPNDLFLSLVDKAGDDTDKRVAIQMKAIKFMKTLKKSKFAQSESSFIKMLMTTFSIPSTSIIKSGRNNYELKFFKNELTNLGIRINYLKKNNGFIKSVSCSKDGLSIMIQSGIEIR